MGVSPASNLSLAALEQIEAAVLGFVACDRRFPSRERMGCSHAEEFLAGSAHLGRLVRRPRVSRGVAGRRSGHAFAAP